MNKERPDLECKVDMAAIEPKFRHLIEDDKIPPLGISHVDLATLMYPDAKDASHQLRLRRAMGGRDIEPDEFKRITYTAANGRAKTGVYGFYHYRTVLALLAGSRMGRPPTRRTRRATTTGSNHGSDAE